MIDDLDNRRSHWSDPKNRAPRAEHDLEDSVPYPWELARLSHLFDNRDVLEIGPGRGRQYDRLWCRVWTYSLCDITALDETLFDSAAYKFLLTDYDDDFEAQFDVVHFWYVLHHIKRNELSRFFAFVARHLRVGGLSMFNTPQTGNASEWYTGDGVGTTWMGDGVVIDAYAPYFDTVSIHLQNDRSSGDLFVVRKL